ncbi:MAG: polysaccharide deacetylase family protein [Clostridia bacterium]|nr:polysaccharide deacetylase family protein [Clostridia bacterium]
MKSFFALTLAFCALFCGKSSERTVFSNDESKRVYACGRTDGQSIALTFDDGPHGEYTEQILDILAEYGVKATFFVIGENAQLYPELILRMKEEGHAVGNHTYCHRLSCRQSAEEFLGELKRTQSILKDLGVKDPLFRPPGGEYDDKVLSAAQSLDYDIILWTVDTRDWRCPSTEQITKGVLDSVKSGDIVLMHDYVWGESNTPEALRQIIPALLKEGYSFKRVDELIRSER